MKRLWGAYLLGVFAGLANHDLLAHWRPRPPNPWGLCLAVMIAAAIALTVLLLRETATRKEHANDEGGT